MAILGATGIHIRALADIPFIMPYIQPMYHVIKWQTNHKDAPHVNVAGLYCALILNVWHAALHQAVWYNLKYTCIGTPSAVLARTFIGHSSHSITPEVMGLQIHGTGFKEVTNPQVSAFIWLHAG